MLEAKSLVKAMVPSTLIRHPSPGNLQSTRLALHANEEGSSCWVYIASGCHIFRVQVPLGGALVGEGKESLLIPAHAQVIDSMLVDRCPHRSEIQSIVLTESDGTGYLMLGSVDSCGHLIVSKLDIGGKDDGKLTYSVLPQDCGIGEGSWAGLCFSPNQWSMIIDCLRTSEFKTLRESFKESALKVGEQITASFSLAAVARSFCKSIDIYDQDMHLRTLRTLWYPSSLNFIENMSNGNGNFILAVAEGCQLSIWDLRMKENGGCLHRISGSLGDIFYAVCSSSTSNIAVGGADRTVTVYDPRRWAALSRWVHCSKYEITGLAFSSINSDYIYVQGMDYEVFCGQWKKSEKVFTFRGDSNWLGFNKCPGRDVIGGWCDSGSIFVADVVG